MSNPTRSLIPSPPIDDQRDQLLYIVAQTSRAHEAEEDLRRKQRQRQEQVIIDAETRELTEEADTIQKNQAGRSWNRRDIDRLLKDLRNPPQSRNPQSRARQWHNNLADISVAPFFIILIVLACVIMPVSQGYTRLDLLAMVLSQDASLSIPPKQSQSTSPSIGGIQLPWWLQDILGGAAAVGLSNTTGSNTNNVVTPQATNTTTLAAQPTGGESYSQDARARPVHTGYIIQETQDDMLGRVPWDE